MTIQEQISKVYDWVNRQFFEDYPEDEGGYTDNIGDVMSGGYTTDGNTARKPKRDTYSTNTEEGPRVVNMNNVGYKAHEIKIIEPHSFSETKQIVNKLRDNKTVIVNLHLLDAEQSQRTVDFVCGAVYAIDGEVKKLNDTTLVFAPETIQLSVEANETNNFGPDSYWGGKL